MAKIVLVTVTCLCLAVLAASVPPRRRIASSSDSSWEGHVSERSDDFGPLRKDFDNRIRGDLEPFTCDGKNDEAGVIYGPDDYGCKGGSTDRVTIKKGDMVNVAEERVRFDGTLQQCMRFVNANVNGDLVSPNLNCFRCYATVSESGRCYLYSDCGKLGYTTGDKTALYCGLT
uniref:Uncharacterized protein n=1 Tax=Tetraselmis sp. GSL018 TaxID=582737 RepID=A0A061RDM3_9CHLO|eukprot:CAMPEP_0177591452 /NCGR_PEP_ID=MMETSP0419_2-20121207/8005_1 /TAXON_ID=582737 /ORGANISM="Tetraselmis sp., Strain GSL018" /LENGTH=172 /DNA_ID=CAMNT_0019082195 /DNA_START=271 /DNA_END=789 /DNA_ORIENTATION=+